VPSLASLFLEAVLQGLFDASKLPETWNAIRSTRLRIWWSSRHLGKSPLRGMKHSTMCRVLLIVLGIVFSVCAAILIDHRLRWRVGLHLARVPRMDRMALNPGGYTIERLPFDFSVSFVREHDVYFVDTRGAIYRGTDTDPAQNPDRLGESHIQPRLLFVSSRGTIFVSGPNAPLLRSVDAGQSWQKSHDWSFWRMIEDEARHVLYAGNYSPQKSPVCLARVFQSTDEGMTWHTTFADDRLDHIHSVAWDALYRNIYLCAGDTGYRGQAYSSDYGKSWHWINWGAKQGHTDVAISERHVFWGTDDNLGRILKAPRAPVRDGTPILWQPHHHVWWIVAHGPQIYAGTLTGERGDKYTGAFLMASSDDGEHWQRLLEDTDGKSAIDAFHGDSRRLSADGWVYVATSSGRSYRVRRTPPAIAMMTSSSSTADDSSSPAPSAICAIVDR
jgi:hypothetical protein